MSQEKIIGLKYTADPAYQEKIYNKAKEILNGAEQLHLKELKTNSVFSALIKNSHCDNQSVLEQIESYTGKSVDLKELRSILILLDAKLESVENSTDKKFVLDGEYEVQHNSGIFEATKKEFKALLEYAKIYDFDKNKEQIFPKLNTDNSVDYYKKNK